MTIDSNTLEKRAAPIEMTPRDFRTLGHQVVDTLADWLTKIPNGRITRGESSPTIREVLRSDCRLPDAGSDPSEIMTEAASLLFEHSLFNAHPRFLGYITSSPAPIGALGDFLPSAINQNCGAFRLAPLATEIEAQTVRWIAELIGFPVDCGGLLVSGG